MKLSRAERKAATAQRDSERKEKWLSELRNAIKHGQKFADFVTTLSNRVEMECKASPQTAQEVRQSWAGFTAKPSEEMYKLFHESEAAGAAIRKLTTLTPEQVENFRTVLAGILGPYAFLMPAADIQAFRDQLQARINS